MKSEIALKQLGLVVRPWSFTGGIVSRHFYVMDPHFLIYRGFLKSTTHNLLSALNLLLLIYLKR